MDLRNTFMCKFMNPFIKFLTLCLALNLASADSYAAQSCPSAFDSAQISRSKSWQYLSIPAFLEKDEKEGAIRVYPNGGGDLDAYLLVSVKDIGAIYDEDKHKISDINDFINSPISLSKPFTINILSKSNATAVELDTQRIISKSTNVIIDESYPSSFIAKAYPNKVNGSDSIPEGARLAYCAHKTPVCLVGCMWCPSIGTGPVGPTCACGCNTGCSPP